MLCLIPQVTKYRLPHESLPQLLGFPEWGTTGYRRSVSFNRRFCFLPRRFAPSRRKRYAQESEHARGILYGKTHQTSKIAFPHQNSFAEFVAFLYFNRDLLTTQNIQFENYVMHRFIYTSLYILCLLFNFNCKVVELLIVSCCKNVSKPFDFADVHVRFRVHITFAD